VLEHHRVALEGLMIELADDKAAHATAPPR
jgi:hypothetical protein